MLRINIMRSNMRSAKCLGNMLIRVAIAKGYCEKAGIKCELQSIPAAPLGMQAMLAKSIDAAFGPAEVMNGAVLRGAKMRMVVGGAVTNVNTLLAGNHLETPNAGKGWPAFMQDLKGKKVAHTSPSSNSGHLAPLALFPGEGLAPDKDYKPVFSGKRLSGVTASVCVLLNGSVVARHVGLQGGHAI